MAVTINEVEKISSTRVKLHTDTMANGENFVVRVSNVKDAADNVINPGFNTKTFQTPSLYISDNAGLMDNLYAFYDFNENCNDLVGSNNGTPTSSAIYLQPGHVNSLYGHSIYWNNGYSYNKIALPDSHNFRNDTFSIYMLVSVGSYSSIGNLAGSGQNLGTEMSWVLEYVGPDNKWFFYVATYDTVSHIDHVELTPPVGVGNGQYRWAMLVCTFDGIDMKIYQYNFYNQTLISNTKTHTNPGSVQKPSGTCYTNIGNGSESDPTYGYFRGTSNYMEAFGYWKKVLTSSEITQLYNARKGMPFNAASD